MTNPVLPSTFLVETGLSSGTAFLIEADTAITAAHVVDGHSFVGLAPVETSTTFAATVPSYVVYVDKKLDLAVLRLLSPIKTEPLELSESVPPLGAEVLAFGAPGGVYRVSEGEILQVTGDSLISSTQVAPGNSGGPLLNVQGDVAGVVLKYDALSENAISINATAVAEFIQSVPDAAWDQVPSTTDEPLIVAWFVVGFLLATILTSIVIFFVMRFRKKQLRAKNLIKITLEGE